MPPPLPGGEGGGAWAPEKETFKVSSVPSDGAGAGVVEVCWTPAAALGVPPDGGDGSGADGDAALSSAWAYRFKYAQADTGCDDRAGSGGGGAVGRGAPSLARSLPREYSTYVSVATFRCLSLAYTERSQAPALFLPRLFHLALFYEALAYATAPTGGGFGAFELALPEAVLAAAQAHLRAAPILVSPLAPLRFGGLGTAGCGVDGCFGSVGAFTELHLDAGSFLLHLPCALTHMHPAPLCPEPESPLRLVLGPVVRGLANHAARTEPLSFLLAAAVVPGSMDPSALPVDDALRPFLRRACLVPASHHRYEARRLPSCASGPPVASGNNCPGNNPAAWASAVEAGNGSGHRRAQGMDFDGAGGGVGWAEDGGCDMLLVWLQNDAGARAYPASDECEEALVQAFVAAASAALQESGLAALPPGYGRMGSGGGEGGGFSWAKVVKGRK